MKSALVLAGVLFAAAVYFSGNVRAQNEASEDCSGCHREIAETYRKTGMARSFYKPAAANTIEDYTRNNTYFHQASDSYFTMLRRDGKYYQRRYQIDLDGKQVSVMEKQVDYIMGSGNHSRAYLNRTSRNTLVELPLAWYAEKGGYWAMNPGYDRPHHDGFRREITYDCMFCHNAYPAIPPGSGQPFAEPVYTGALPQGIDCQRCHGSGSKHTQLAKTAGAKREEIRNSIVNPARLSADRQMEVCMQCHLETTSFPLPNSIQRYERGPFSYQPGEPLSAFILAFDHASGSGREDKYEIVNQAYRLRRSACFLQSKGKLECTTCHNPHDIRHGEEAAKHYTAVCRQCHGAAFNRLVAAGKHTREEACADCHMPKRRTEDVVHVAMTDHYIQRRKPAGDLLADIAERHESEGEAYHGEVVPYYPKDLLKTGEDALYLALAQVIQSSNLKAGISQLAAAMKRQPARAEFYFELAEAWRKEGQLDQAFPLYEEAVRRNPKFVVALQKLGLALRRSGHPSEATELSKRAALLAPQNPVTWQELGLEYQAQGKIADASVSLQKAVDLDPDMAEAHNNLGVIWAAGNEPSRAEAAFREAIRIQPDYADAHGNLANLLSGTGDWTQARYQFEVSLRLRPDDAATHYGYATVLGRTGHYDEAQSELEKALRADPNLIDAHMLLGDLSMAKGQTQAALPHYREAVRISPGQGRANLALGAALVSMGDTGGAVPYLRKAASDADPSVREEAARILTQLRN